MSMYPAIIKSYDAQRRKVRIEMVGLTDGDSLLPEADLMYSLGDKSKHTEIEILAGDAVWVDFLANDPRYPIIVGFRNPEIGNSVAWRKWHHANIELHADGTLLLKGTHLVTEFETITNTGVTINNSEITNKSPVVNEALLTNNDMVINQSPVMNNALVSMNAGMNNAGGGAVTCTGSFEIKSGDVAIKGGGLSTTGGGITVDGGDVVANGISLQNHTHQDGEQRKTTPPQ